MVRNGDVISNLLPSHYNIYIFIIGIDIKLNV